MLTSYICKIFFPLGAPNNVSIPKTGIIKFVWSSPHSDPWTCCFHFAAVPSRLLSKHPVSVWTEMRLIAGKSIYRTFQYLELFNNFKFHYEVLCFSPSGTCWGNSAAWSYWLYLHRRRLQLSTSSPWILSQTCQMNRDYFITRDKIMKCLQEISGSRATISVENKRRRERTVENNW